MGISETHVDHSRLVGVLAGKACSTVAEVILLNDTVCCIGRYGRQRKCTGCGLGCTSLTGRRSSRNVEAILEMLQRRRRVQGG